MKTKSVVRTKVNTIICYRCNDEIYSRARHDFHHCSCREIFIDGGFDYLRFGAMHLGVVKHKARYLKVTKEKLYQDWNTGEDKYGVIKK